MIIPFIDIPTTLVLKESGLEACTQNQQNKYLCAHLKATLT